MAPLAAVGGFIATGVSSLAGAASAGVGALAGAAGLAGTTGAVGTLGPAGAAASSGGILSALTSNAVVGTLGLVGTGLSVYSALQQGNQQASNLAFNAQQQLLQARQQAALLSYQAAVAGSNARISEANSQISKNNATAAIQQSRYNAQRIRERNRRLKGKQIAGFSKSGVQIEGTPEAVILDSAIQGELEALLALYQGSIDAGRYNSEAMNFIAQAGQHRNRAKFLEAQGRFTVGNAQAESNLLLDESRNVGSASNLRALALGIGGVAETARTVSTGPRFT